MARPSQDIQTKAIAHVRDTFSDYDRLSKPYREEFLDIYEETYSYKEKKRADWSVVNKVNKIQSIIEKVVPRFIAKSPKYLLSERKNSFNFEQQDPDALDAAMKAMQDYLTMVFDQYNQIDQVERCAIMMAVYGTCIAKIDYRYETATLINEKGTKEEQVTAQYPTIKPISWTNIYIDPRYKSLDEMPAIIEVEDGVRLQDLKRKAQEGKVFNIDKIESVANIDAFEMDDDSFKQQVFAITGINDVDSATTMDKDALNVKTYYGFFKESDEGEEKMYKMSVVDDMVLIEFEVVDSHPYVDFHAFLDPEVFYSDGFAQRLVGLQRDANFKMNSASEMINMGLNHMFFWSPLSGVNPRDLVSRPGGIVPTKDTELAVRQVQEIPFKQVPNDYFQDRNDKERDFQVLSHTIDTTNQRNAQALTNTATGARISFFESNAVMDSIRRRFEKSLEKLGYKFLETAFDNIEDNIIVKKQGDEGFWGVNKEAFRNAINRYDIKVEANSSSFDNIEGRREEAIAIFNTALQASQAGVPTDVEKAYLNVLDTFETKDPESFIRVDAGLEEAPGGGSPLPQPEAQSPDEEAVELTEQVAGGTLGGEGQTV